MLKHLSEFHSLFRSIALCIYHILFIHSFIPVYLRCFHLLDIVNNAAVNIGVQIPILFNLGGRGGGYIPRGCMAGSSSDSLWSFLRNCHSSFHSDSTMLHSHQ